VIVYIDENFPTQLADGLNILVQHPYPGLQVLSIKNTFGQGVADENWIPQAGQQGAVVITQDLNINRTRSQRELFLKSGLGVFFFKPPSRNGFSYWEMLEQVLKRWKTIVELSEKSKKPFAFLCRVRGKDFERI
jgi:hypothetical protein